MHVVMLSNASPYEAWAGRQNLGAAMSRYVPVRYLWAPRGSGRPLVDGPLRRRASTNLVYAGWPGWIPGFHWRPRLGRCVRALKRAYFRRQVNGSLKGPRVLYVWEPGFEYCVGGFGEDLLCYHMYDNQAGFVEREAERQRTLLSERRMVERADVVISASRALADRYDRSDTLICPGGVGEAFLRRLGESGGERPADLPGGGPVLGYAGGIHDKVDLGCLERLAGANRDWQLVLIGTNAYRGELRERFSRLAACPNVHHLGPRPWHVLPDYVRWFDVGLLPYAPTDVSEWCEVPAKLYEYLGAGLPVVEMALPHADSLDGVVRVARSADEFAVQVERALGQDTPEQRDRRKRLAWANTWERRAECIFGRIVERLAEKGRAVEPVKRSDDADRP